VTEWSDGTGDGSVCCTVHHDNSIQRCLSNLLFIVLLGLLEEYADEIKLFKFEQLPYSVIVYKHPLSSSFYLL